MTDRTYTEAEAQALVAATLTEAAGLCEQFADTELTAASPAYAAGHSDGADRCEQAILALITPDASAALDRIVRDAVRAETDRCAKVAEDRWNVWKSWGPDRCPVECDVTACEEIAAAIRAGAGKGET